MRRGVRLTLLGIVVGALGVATARAAAPAPPSGTATTATTATISTTTTTAATTTTATPTTTTTTPATTSTRTTTTARPQPSAKPEHPNRRHHSKKHRRPPLPNRPPPDFPPAPDPLLAGGGLTRAAQENAVVSIAARYLGVPYKWGGATPKTGFDCSGLVQYVFAQLGVSLPHYAASQWYSPDAVWIPPDRLQPGDLVFFIGADGTRAAPGHVGIYVGDGFLIDAPHTGAFVRVDSLDGRWFANNYVGAKRILGVSLDAHRFLRAESISGAGPVVPLIHRQLVGAVGGSPPLIAAVRTAAHTSSPESHESWTAVGGGAGAVLLLLLLGGAATYRRRRRAPEPDPS